MHWQDKRPHITHSLWQGQNAPAKRRRRMRGRFVYHLSRKTIAVKDELEKNERRRSFVEEKRAGFPLAVNSATLRLAAK